MKSKIYESKTSFVFAALILICVSFAASADAQTARKRRTTKRTAKPAIVSRTLPYPQQQTEPEIVSRADDYNQNPAVVVVVPQTVDERIDKVGDGIKDLRTRVKSLETNKANAYDEKQKRLALNLDILTKAETRAESLRKQMFEMAEKEGAVKMRLEQLENDSRPEMIDRSAAFAGTLRPEEVREARRKNLESERENLQTLLTAVQTNRSNLELNVQKADALVEKLRFKLEKDIDDALVPEDNQK